MDQSTLQAFENKCTADSPPACQAACPLHMDARGFIAHMQKGKWDKAREIVEKSLPFAPLMSLLCDKPCEAVCRRAEKGESLAIKALELACLQIASPGKPKRRLPSKDQSVAVLGCGLAGLTAAWDLALKGYNVVLHHQTKRPQDFLQQNARHYLPAFATDEAFTSALAEAFSQLDAYGLQYRQTVSPPLLNDIRKNFTAIFIDFEDYTTLAPSEAINTLTGSLGTGSLNDEYPVVYGGQSLSGIMKACEGRRGAITVTRLLGKSSPLAMREQEGPHQTDLFVDLSAVEPLPRALERGEKAPEQSALVQHELSPDHKFLTGQEVCPPLTAEQAMQEAARCLQCACLHCVKSCTYLKHYGDIPKHNARKMFVNLGIFTGYRRANQQINSCSLCGQCEALCPNGFSMGELCLLMRQDMVKQGKMPPSAHDFALRELAWSTAPSSTLFGGTSADEPCSHVFFPGCQLAAARPNQIRFIFRHLRQSFANKDSAYKIGIWLRCCGIPAHFAGRDDLTCEQISELQSQWEALGKPEVIAACASCLRFFQDHLPQIPTLSLWEVLDTMAPLPLVPHNHSSLLQHEGTIHDPCSARHNNPWQTAVRSLLTKHGVRFEEPQDTTATTACCGYGGLVWNANPNLAEQMAKDRAEALPSTPLTSCIMCRDRFVESGKPSLHLFDILLPSETFIQQWLKTVSRNTDVSELFFKKRSTGQAQEKAQDGHDMDVGQTRQNEKDLNAIAAADGPGFSLRRVTRMALKEAFMKKEFISPRITAGGEKADESLDSMRTTSSASNLLDSNASEASRITLVIAPDVLKKVEKQHILTQDMEETIQKAEEQGTLFISDDGLHRAHNRQRSITFWVEYRKEGKSHVILDAYYHRMIISKA